MRAVPFSMLLAAMFPLLLAACGTQDGGASTSASTVNATLASGYGVVDAVDVVPRESAGIGLGTIGGAAVGGVLGSQVGEGRGRTAATIAGAAGGAYVGRQWEKNRQSGDQVYRVTIRMDDGSRQTTAQETSPDVQPGDRVRIANGVMQRY
ncbi:MAG: glycine zipper 2TM domain-containing protein [Pseudomonadota bacterium]